MTALDFSMAKISWMKGKFKNVRNIKIWADVFWLYAFWTGIHYTMWLNLLGKSAEYTRILQNKD
jgi:hypothetical protein